MELQLEVAALRHQVEALRRDRRSRIRLTRLDRALWVLLYRLWSGCLDAVLIRQAGDRRPAAPTGLSGILVLEITAALSRTAFGSIDIKSLIKRISRDNVLWGASRIHGELLKLGIEISQAAVSKYMMRPSKPP